MSDFVERIVSERLDRMMAEREEKTLLEAIRALMDTLHGTAEEAMNLLKIPPEKQKELAPLI